MQIVCDGCGNTVTCGSGKQRRQAHIVRTELRNAGWVITGDPHGDFCNACTPPKKTSRNVQPRLTAQRAEAKNELG